MFPVVILCWYREPMRQNESQETRFNDFSALAQEVDKTNANRLDLMAFRPWLQKSTKPVPGDSICNFPAMAPEVDKTSPRKLGLVTFWPWLQKSQNLSQETRINDFPAMAPEVDKTSPSRLDFMIFEPWIQESTKQWLS